MSSGNLLTKIPVLSTEWSVTLDFRIHSPIPDSHHLSCNIVHFTKGGSWGSYGDRTPFIGIIETSYKLHITSAINGNHDKNRNIPNILEINQLYHLEVNQRYVSNGEYLYTITLDGEDLMSIVNSDARQFYNVKVYAGNPWNANCPVYISNFKITNFL